MVLKVKIKLYILVNISKVLLNTREILPLRDDDL